MKSLNRFNLLQKCFKYFLQNPINRPIISSNKNIITNTNCVNSFSTSSQLLFGKNRYTQQYTENLKKKVKFIAVFLAGGFIYFLYHVKSKEKSGEIVLDLNEIYERCAVLFLANPELHESLGVPIKITSSDSDLVREIHLRRQGNELFSFISYRLQGAHNSGTVYCKLKMIHDTQKFNTEEIILRLDKPHKKRREIIIMGAIKKNDNKSDSN